MNKKVFHTLEYDKIIQKLIKHAASPLGKQYCRDLTPYTDEEMITYRITKVFVSILFLLA